MATSPPDSRRWIVLGVLCLSLLVIGLDNTILNVALPTLQVELDASTSQLQWILDGYILVFAGLLLTAGALGDRFGRRKALQVGLGIFGLGSVLSVFATEPAHLIATRSLMGVGGAFIMPATLSIVTNVFTDAKERARAIAIWAGFSAIGIAIGPVTGGWLLEHFFWGSVFLVNVPVVIVALIAGRMFVPESRDPSAPRLDPVGALLSIVGLSAAVYAIIEAPGHGWTSGTVLAAGALGLAALSAFVVWELRSDHPMLDVRIFSNRRFTAASAAITLVFFALFGSLFLLTQYLQVVLGFSALEAGIRLLPLAGTLMVVAPLSARLVERIGTKAVVSTGMATVAAGLFWLSTVEMGEGYGFVVIGEVLIAFGMGLVMAPATESIMGSLPRDKAGVGSAVNDTTREIGGALGVAVIGSVFSSIYGSEMGNALAGTPMPAEAAAAASDSVGAAAHIASTVGGPQGRALLDLAQRSFIEGMSTAVLIGAVVALAGALFALLFLPARAAEGLALGEGVDGDETVEPTSPIDLAELTEQSERVLVGA